MQQDEDASNAHVLPYTVHAKFWRYAAAPMLLVLLLGLTLVMSPPRSEYRWQAYAFVGLLELPLLLLLIWLASRRIALSKESVSVLSPFTKARVVRYADIRSVKMKVTYPYDTPSHRTTRYQLSITARNGRQMLIEVRSYHVRDLRLVVEVIVTHAPSVSLNAIARQLLTGQFPRRP